MKKFVICDDETFYLEKVKTLVQENLEKAGVTGVELYAFSSGTKLLEQEKLLAKCQAVFLDINMQDCSGLDIAFQIKQKNPDILLIFVTAYMDYVLAGYRPESLALSPRYAKTGLRSESAAIPIACVSAGYALCICGVPGRSAGTKHRSRI